MRPEEGNGACNVPRMRLHLLAGLFLVGCGSDPVASERASLGYTQGPIQKDPARLTMGPLEIVVQLDRPAYAITGDHDNVYFTTAFKSSDEIDPANVMQCAKTGCDVPTPIAFGSKLSTSIAVDASRVYWLGSNDVLSCPIGGCGGSSPAVVTDGSIRNIASNGSLFWVGDGTIRACDGSNCAATTRTVHGWDAKDAVQVSADATNVFYRNALDDAIVRCSADDCASPARVATNFGAAPFAIDATNIYFRTPSGISRCNKMGCREAAVIAPLDEAANVQSIVADGVHVFWIANYAVYTCPVSGCAKPTLVAAAGAGVDTPNSANALAIDDHYVYWTSGVATSWWQGADGVDHHGPGMIMRLAK